MGMFDGFDSNNLTPAIPEEDTSVLQSSSPTKPYEDYNIEGDLIGYWWYYGDAIDLQFDISGEVTFDGSEDYMTAEEFLADKYITIQLFNFRREVVEAHTYAGTTPVVFEIDKELSESLTKGSYYCTLTVWKDNNFNKTLFYQTDATLTVK